jgi:hypothetical protein
MQMRFVRAFVLSCACSAAASAVVAVAAPRRDWGDVLPEYPTPGGGTVIAYTLVNAIVILFLTTPILLGLKWATRNRLKLSAWAWGALGLTIPMVAYLAIVVPDFLDQFEKWQLLGDLRPAWTNFWPLAWGTILEPERLAFGPLMPPVIGGGAFGWLLFRPEATPSEPDPSPQC